jgi:predicted DNA-binding transcriptional regulator AlpA
MSIAPVNSKALKKAASMETSWSSEDELLTVPEIASALKVPVSWIYDRVRRSGPERIPHIKLGKYLRFRWLAVQRWLDGLNKG